MKPKVMYCIKCEKMYPAQNGNPAEFVHEYFVGGENINYMDYDVCEFPEGFATCPPPPSIFDSVLENGVEDGVVDFLNQWEKWCSENDPEFQTEVFA